MKTTSMKTKESVQKLCEFVFLSVVIVPVIFCTMPLFFYAYYVYFTTDLGEDAFELPIPMW